MINSISLQNFKLFRERKGFGGLKSINILTGVNGRGKSTLIQSLLLPKQTLEENEYARAINLNGNYIKLGNAIDVKNEKSNRSTPIEFGYEIDGTELSLCMSVSDDSSQVLDIDNVIIEGKSYNCQDKSFQLFNLIPKTDETAKYEKLSACLSSVRYVSADRIGPKLHYPPSKDKEHIDPLGEYCACVLHSHKDNETNEDFIDGIKDIFPGEKELNDCSFNGMVEFWMGKMFGPTKIRSEYVSSANVYVLGYVTSERTAESNPTNVGYGYSYVLPVIVAGLLSKKGDVFIVENPEAHLHPQAQSVLGKFLAWITEYSGVQVFVETHSEHIVNSFRVLVKQEVIDSENLNIIFFDQEYKDWAVNIPVGKNGEIQKWPVRFFDQEEKDLDILTF